jgi:hypothetical protein
LTTGSKDLEARVGIEPTHKGFADLSLTTWVPRPAHTLAFQPGKVHGPGTGSLDHKNLERETGVEPATSTLARSRSTTELLPLKHSFYSRRAGADNSGGVSTGAAPITIVRTEAVVRFHRHPRLAALPGIFCEFHLLRKSVIAEYSCHKIQLLLNLANRESAGRFAGR